MNRTQNRLKKNKNNEARRQRVQQRALREFMDVLSDFARTGRQEREEILKFLDLEKKNRAVWNDDFDHGWFCAVTSMYEDIENNRHRK